MRTILLVLNLLYFGLIQSQNYASIANNHLYWDLNFKGERNFSLNDSTFICLKLQMFRCFDDSLNLKWEYRDKDKGNSIASNIIRDEEGFCFLTKSRSKALDPKSKVNLIKLDYKGNEIFKKTITGFNPRFLYQYDDDYIFISNDAIGTLSNDDFTEQNLSSIGQKFNIIDELQIQEKIYILGFTGSDDNATIYLYEYDIPSHDFEDYEIELEDFDYMMDIQLSSSEGMLFASTLTQSIKGKETIVRLLKFDNKNFQEIYQEEKAGNLDFIKFDPFESGQIFIAVQEESFFEESEYYSYEKAEEKGNIHYFILSTDGKAIKTGEIPRKALWSLSIKQYAENNESSNLGLVKASITDASNRSERFTSISCIIDGNAAYFTLPVGKNLSMFKVDGKEEVYYPNILKSIEGESFNKIYFSPDLSFKAPGSLTFGYIFSNTVTPALVDLTNKLYIVKVEELD